MIQTSYFANHRHFPDGKKTVSISAFTPNGVNVDSYALELAPRPQLLKEYKEGIIDEAGYRKRYIDEVLVYLDPIDVSRRYKDCIFLCYEKTGEFCHRHIVSEWLSSAGVPVEEVMSTVNIAVVGSRDFQDYKYFVEIIDRLVSNYKNFTFVSGGAKSGADNMIERYCMEKGSEVVVHLPDWQTNGKSAGFIRNKMIIDNSDIGIAFWDGESRGTEHSIKLAIEQKKKFYVVNFVQKKISYCIKNT